VSSGVGYNTDKYEHSPAETTSPVSAGADEYVSVSINGVRLGSQSAAVLLEGVCGRATTQRVSVPETRGVGPLCRARSGM